MSDDDKAFKHFEECIHPSLVTDIGDDLDVGQAYDYAKAVGYAPVVEDDGTIIYSMFDYDCLVDLLSDDLVNTSPSLSVLIDIRM